MSELHALLLTDIVDSTRLAQQLGDEAMAALWEQHDRVARTLLRQWRGREIDKSDGFLLLFASVADALGYVLAYHHALSGLGTPLAARAGLHAGAVTLRENDVDDIARGAKPLEVEGLSKPIAARVMSLALPRQTLLTASARNALGETSLALRSHGWWRLKGIEEAIELFEIGEDEASFSVPPDNAKVYRVVRRNDLWVPLREVRHSLPAERDTFVGRQAPLEDLSRRFAAGARLVSVLGIGGAGKSRLAQRFGWTWLGDYPGGVWFCDLSPARTLDGIAYAVAQGLDVPLGAGDPVVQLGHAIAGRGACLVILDNFEQVSRFAEDSIGHWLNRAPDARFIVTTREVLGVTGEETLALMPLAPSEAAALFLRRAASVKPDVPPTPEDKAAIASLMKLLDGLPLAIELAAARVRVMPPRMLLSRMSERFKILSSGGGRRDRQATLRAAFDWSWDMLSPAERTALAQLSVFESGFTIIAAEAILDLSAVEPAPWPLDVLQSLVEKSFVRRVSDERFDLLGSVLDYAAEHLSTEGRFDGSGPSAADAAKSRHWHHFATLNEREAVYDRCIDTENLVVACRRAAEHGDSRSAVGALQGAWAALRLRGPFKVALDLATRVCDMPDLLAAQRATALWVAGNALCLLGQAAEGRRLFETGLALAQAAGDSERQAWLLCAIGERLTTEGRMDEARAALMQAKVLADQAANRALLCRIENETGALAYAMSNADEARSHYEAALALARSLGDRHWEGGLLGNLGGLLHAAGRFDDARAHYEQALVLANETGDRRWEGNTRCNLGLLHHEQGRPEQAREQFEAALALALELGHVRLEAVARCNLAIVIDAQGFLDEAKTQYEKALALADDLGDRRSQGQFKGYLGRLCARRGEFDEARACLASGEALLQAVGDRSSLGILLCCRAKAEQLAGDPAAALVALQRAEQLAVEAHAAPDSELSRELASLSTNLPAADLSRC